MIILNENLAIDSDTNQWKLCKHQKATENNPESWPAFKFFTTFSACTEAARQHLLRTSKYDSFADLERNLKAINKLLEKKLRSI